ncbi:hypothetical protein D3C81_1675850 [compost metagenome]
MAGAAVQRLLLDEQRLMFKCCLGTSEIADRQVQAALQQLAFQFGGGGRQQFQGHRLVTLAKTADGGGDLRQHRLVERLGNPHAHFAEQLAGHAARFLAKAVDGDEQPTGGLQQVLALGRQAEATLAALAQAVAETGFQLGHLDADARLT